MEVDLHITNKCNLRCKHCVYSSGEIIMEDLKLCTLENLINGFKKMKVKEVHLTGGEPLLNSEVFDIISLLNKNNFLVRIQTNGFLLDENVVKKLKCSGIKGILVSLDGLKAFHDNFRNFEGCYDKVLESIKISLKYKIFTRVNTVLLHENVEQIRPLMQKCKALKVDCHSFFYFTSMGRAKNIKSSMFTLKEWKKIQEYIIKVSEEIDFKDKVKVQDVFHEGDLDYSVSPICRNDNCLILSNGNVYHCVFFANTPYSLGNIHKEDIYSIWKNCDNLINKLVSCSKSRCDNKKCGGGCPGMSYYFRKNILNCDLRCDPKNLIFSNCIRKYRS